LNLTTLLRYDIGSFVYRARRPFDPSKLYHVLKNNFVLIQPELEEEQEEDDEEEQDENIKDEDLEDSDGILTDSEMTEYDAKWKQNEQECVMNKKAHPLFRGIHRSTGSFWLATRPNHWGGWNSAGAILTLDTNQPWFCMQPQEEWTDDKEVKSLILSDFIDPWGDRRQEIVFIGEGLDEGALIQLFDSCLLNDKDWKFWEKVMENERLSLQEKNDLLQEKWEDNWAEWPPLSEYKAHSTDNAHIQCRHGHPLEDRMMSCT
jgi:G3E family GTPase